MSPTTPTATTPTPAAREICEWFRVIIAKEQAYYAAVGRCFDEHLTLLGRIDALRTELRATPDPEKWVELAKMVTLANALHAEGQHAPFESRSYYLPLRSARHPDYKDRIRALADWAKDYASARLAASVEADEKLTTELDAKDPVISGTTRKLQSLLATVGQVEEKLALRDDDQGQVWRPFEGLVSEVEGVLP